MATGVDLVAEQLHIAAGRSLRLRQEDIVPRGAVIECRVNAEDPARDFVPTPGLLTEFVPPGGPFVRVDTHGYTGFRISPAYDSLLAKIIVWAPDRTAAISRMCRALDDFRISGEGVSTTRPFLRRILRDQRFATATHSTALATSQVA